ncbi:MFS transporter [Pseudoalteromonas fenneropenaei]|uniref:MFS transporter n=1 Tax=Pseudoalteromonas fenneropenaei TaxID=1737459 RepID=A0ABV7CPU7_9GAMM
MQTPLSASLNQRVVLNLAILVNILSIGSFMMVMPMGPDFSLALGMPAEHTGYLAGGATFAAALIGFLCAPFLDKFDRKQVLVSCLSLKFLLILCCAFATSPWQLITLFVLSACFSGPAGGVLMAAILDVTPVAYRGRAMAMMASGFSIAAIIAVPMTLELVARLNWQTAFYGFGGLGLLLVAVLQWRFPSLTAHQSAAQHNNVPAQLITNPAFRFACAIAAVQMFGHFLLIPHFSSYFQFNLGFARNSISSLYLFGGLASLLALQLSGRLLDKGHGLALIWSMSLLAALVVIIGLVFGAMLSVYAFFIIFMAASTVRSSSTSALLSSIPAPYQRAAYMSYQATVANIASGLGALCSALWLSTNNAQQLQGLEQLAVLAALCLLCAPVLVHITVKRFLAPCDQSQATHSLATND